MRKTNKSKSVWSGLLAALFIALLCPGIAFLQESKREKELVMGIALHPLIPNTSLAGKGMANMRDIFQIAADEFKKLYRVTLTLKIYPAPKFLFKALQDKTLDCSALLPFYLYAKNHGMPVTSLGSFGETGEKEGLQCIYVHKDSGIKNIKELKGKRFVQGFPGFLSKKDTLPYKESYLDWIITKKILIKNGITAPLKEFFKEFKALPAPSESVAYSVMLKKFDACIFLTSFMQSLKNYDPGFSELVPLTHSCISLPADWPLFCRNDTDAQMLQTLKNYFLSPPKGSQLEKIIKKEFKGMKLYPVAEKDYAVYFQLLKEAEQKGWLKEFDEIMKKVPKPK